MNKHVQIRSLPEATHRQLKSRAAGEGLSISDYLKRLIERDLRKPTWTEFDAKMRKLKPVAPAEPAAQMIRKERDSR
ncbi:MAG: hypothetical protein K2Q06_16835 [Parvularculaceae bacterium]|nr:hypothetical protein [Parvularculaceae bacterium]